MFWKIAFAAMVILAVLWAAGFDFRGAKDALIGAAEDNAGTLTGSSGQGDWAD